MKEQTRTYLDKPGELLGQAETIFAAGLYEPAGRTAYLADFTLRRRLSLKLVAVSTKATAASKANLPAR